LTATAPFLTPLQARKFAFLKFVLVGSLIGSAVAFVAGVALFFLPHASTALRSLTWGIFIEMAVSGAVLGGLARCPACQARLGSRSGKLLPAKCASCGVALSSARI
jgi:hypothetical protein